MEGDITKEQLVNELDSSFSTVALEDIKRALDPNVNTTLAVFILGVCLIDALAGFRFGKEVKNDKKDGERFKDFVKIYIKQYNANDLWKVRNGMLHSYAVEKYAFVNKKSYLHDQSTNGGKIINDENFYKDLETAYKTFREHILTSSDQTIFKNAKKRYEAIGLMKIRTV